jgi:hypothetical protein
LHDLRGWKRVDPSDVTVDQRFSLNYSPCSWAVLTRSGVVAAEEQRDMPPKVPPGIRLPEQLGLPRAVQRGRSGILLGFDRGEWGGALLWYAVDGTFRQKVLDDNIVELLPTATGFTVFAGLSHLGSDTGRATELVDSGSRYHVRRSAELGSAPGAVFTEQSGAVLVATMAGMVRLQPDFQVQELLRTSWGMFYPVSLVVDGHTAYVGMRGIVAEIQFGADGTTETWLAPKDLK